MASNSILTYCGNRFDFAEPWRSEISIIDIAHALSNICRFGGHCSRFYSVAQHSVMVSRIVPAEHAPTALMHDATEAYLGDISRPLKAMLPDYRCLDAAVEEEVSMYYGVTRPLPDCVIHADLVMLATEKRDLMPQDREEWACLKGIEPLPERIFPLPPEEAKGLFLDRFYGFLTTLM